MQIIFIDLDDVVETIQLCSGPTDIWAQFGLPPEPWTSGRLSGNPALNFNGRNHDAADAIVLDSCEIFVAGYVFWYTGVYGNTEYSRVFSVSTNGGGSYSTLADIYPYTAGNMPGAYDPLYWANQINSMALAAQGNIVYVLHNTADGGQYQAEPPPLNNYLITSKTTDLGNTWTHEVSTTNQISTTAAIYTDNGLFHVGGDTKTNLENNQSYANLYVNHSIDQGQTWTLTKALDASVARAVSDWGYSRLATSVANVNNYCGVLFNGYDAVTGNGIIYYLNPTSNTTWDIKTLYDHSTTDTNYYFTNLDSPNYNRVKLLSLEQTPGTLLAFYGDYGTKIHRFISTDSGDTWTGPSQVYPISVFDEVTPDVTLSRWSWGPLINTKIENETSWNNSPLGTEWNADGWTDLSDVTTRTYGTFYDVAGGGVGQIGNYVKTYDLVMHTISSDRYFKFKFSNWGNASTGASFVYTRQEIDSATGANISGQVTVTKPVFEEGSDIDSISWGPNFDAVELADGNVVVTMCAQVPNEGFNAIKYMISTDGGSNFIQHGWASNATLYGENLSDKFASNGYKALASGNDVLLIGSTIYGNENNAIRFTPQAGTIPPQIPSTPASTPLILENDPTWVNTAGITFTGATHVSIDWGDGETQVIYKTSTSSQTYYHDYGANLTLKTISITGKAPTISFPAFNRSGYTALKSWGTLVDFNYISFEGCTNFVSVPANLHSNVANLYNVFNGCTFFNDSNIAGWNTSNVTNMAGTFSFARAFNQPIGSWNTANVTNMNSMFWAANVFNQDIGSWNTGNVTNMGVMFFEATDFNQNLSGWCVSNIIATPGQFDDAATSWSLPRPVWGTCPVAGTLTIPSTPPLELRYTRSGAGGDNYVMTFVGANVDVWVDWGDGQNVQHVTNTNPLTHVYGFGTNTIRVWGQAESFRLGDGIRYQSAGISHVDSWGDLIGFNSLSNTFADSFSIVNVPDTLHPNVTSLSYAFSFCEFFNGANVTTWDTSNITNMSYTFNNAYLFNRDIGNWNTGNVTNMTGMFDGADVFNQDLSGWCVSNITIEPVDFDRFTTAWVKPGRQPVWGTCP